MNMKMKLVAMLGISSVLSLAAIILLRFDDLKEIKSSTITPTLELVQADKPDTFNQPLVCQDLLEQDENSLLAVEYSKLAVADCMFVGCGGTF